MSVEATPPVAMSAELTPPVAIFEEVTAPLARSTVRIVASLMSSDLTWPFLMSSERTVFLPASAPAVPLMASTRTATIGASLGLRAGPWGVVWSLRTSS